MHTIIRTWKLLQGLAGRIHEGLASVSVESGHFAHGTLSAKPAQDRRGLRCSSQAGDARTDGAERSSSALLNSRQNNLAEGGITATVIECPGRWEDSIFEAVQIDVEGLKSPFVMTMALPKGSYRALSEFVKPGDLYRAIVDAINKAQASVKVEHG